LPPIRFEVNEDYGYQQKEWRFEQVGAVVWVLMLLAGIAGLLGSGPLSSAGAASSDGSLHAEYNRITRRQADSEIRFGLSTGTVRDGAIRLRVDRSFVESVELEGIQPEPREVVQAGDRVVFVFAAEPAGPATVRFRFRPGRVGMSEHRFAADTGEVRLRSFVLP
jgi:protein-L-isoaspartate(D-aspartate) O-methyltransferase